MTHAHAVNIVVLIYNQRHLAEQCIASVLSAKTDAAFRLTLIDDASTESGIDAMLAGFAGDPRVRVVRNPENMGFTKTANIGLRLSKDAHPLLLNSDTIVYDHWLDVMLDALLHAAPKVASVNPMTNQNGSHISCYPLQTWSEKAFPEIDDRVLAKIAFESCRSLTCQVHTCVGFCMLLNNDCISEIGLLDEVNFPRAYGEESDFCYRARYSGWCHLVAGGAFVTHLHGKALERKKISSEMT
jgi:GT2 family glycosyltransferase